jgi:tRNA (guanine-N7-)-methyltransferase
LARGVSRLTGPAQVWTVVFGNPLPVEIEVGPGRGDVLLSFAAGRPDTNFFAIERSAGLAELVTARAAAAGLGNVRVVAGDARCIVAELVPAASVAAFHVYFPDPWPKTRNRHRRLFDRPDLWRGIARALVPGGRVYVASDLSALQAAMCARLCAAGLTEASAAGPSRPLSKFERKYATAGTHAAVFIKPA